MGRGVELRFWESVDALWERARMTEMSRGGPCFSETIGATRTLLVRGERERAIGTRDGGASPNDSSQVTDGPLRFVTVGPKGTVLVVEELRAWFSRLQFDAAKLPREVGILPRPAGERPPGSRSSRAPVRRKGPEHGPETVCKKPGVFTRERPRRRAGASFGGAKCGLIVE